MLKGSNEWAELDAQYVMGGEIVEIRLENRLGFIPPGFHFSMFHDDNAPSALFRTEFPEGILWERVTNPNQYKEMFPYDYELLIESANQVFLGHSRSKPIVIRLDSYR